MPHLSSYLHPLFIGMQMWHLPSLPYIYSPVFKYLRHICKEKICAHQFFCPVFNKSRCWTPSVVCLNKQPKLSPKLCLLEVSFWMLLTFDLGYFSLWQSNRGFSCLSLLTLKNELRIPTPNRFHDRLNWIHIYRFTISEFVWAWVLKKYICRGQTTPQAHVALRLVVLK